MDSWSAIGNELLEKFIIEIKKTDNMSKIQTNIMDPLIEYLIKKLYPYIMASTILFLLILLFLILVFIMLFRTTGIW